MPIYLIVSALIRCITVYSFQCTSLPLLNWFILYVFWCYCKWDHVIKFFSDNLLSMYKCNHVFLCWFCILQFCWIRLLVLTLGNLAKDFSVYLFKKIALSFINLFYVILKIHLFKPCTNKWIKWIYGITNILELTIFYLLSLFLFYLTLSFIISVFIGALYNFSLSRTIIFLFQKLVATLELATYIYNLS